MNITRTPLVLKLYAWLLLLIFGLIVLHAPLSVGLGTLFPDFSLLIKSWKELLMLLAIPSALILISRRRLWSQLLSDPLIWLLGLYGLIHAVIAFILPTGTAATLAGLAIDLRYLLFFGLVYILIEVAPQYRRPLVTVGTAGAFLVVGFGALQLFLPADILTNIGYGKSTIAPYLTVDKNPEFIRVNSTLRGPNPLGAYAVIVLGIVTAAYARGRLELRRWRVLAATMILVVCSLVTAWISYSRSALIAVAVTLGIVGVMAGSRKLSPRSWVIAVTITCALIGGLIAARGSTLISNVVLHENPTGGSDVSSNDGHVESLRDGVARFIHQPLGAGVGSTGSASLQGPTPLIIENQYLLVAHEVGWLGLVLFMAASGVVLTRLWRRRSDWLAFGVFASGIGLALIGLLLPVWVDDTVAIVWWGLAAIAVSGRKAI